ncbi:hypothetical protein E4T96_23610 [Shigella flexneri]|uniref:Immunity protein CdiI n=1 Tax=Escherichia coli TaxID=562 RepID=CDII_ECOLX|nr:MULTISPECIES: hypothetical protein [Enterobacteriaceae]Q3YL95.1 RecName: Full=Immunity protein CdiI [Escherichia coli]AXN93629.1 CdiI [Cloning vector pCC-CDI]AXN93638.1 CdiI [Cloning vector pCDI-ccdB]EFN6683500.1 hypothetical protein [Escherichia coli O179:H8]AAZ57199.1 CdiI [Escherichia coli]EFN6749712.1 hypothetical protein [Escherichia coli O179:H8]
MKKKLFALLKYIIFFPMLCTVLGLLGIPIGLIVNFLRTGSFDFNLKDEIDVVLFTLKIGIPIGFILGLGLWGLSILDRK